MSANNDDPSSFYPPLGPSVGWTDLLDYEIEKTQKEKAAEGKKYHPLRPSSAGACARRLAYELHEYRGNATYPKEVLKPELYRLFELGHAVEHASLKTFRLLKDVDQRFRQQILTFFKLEATGEIIEGSCDAVFWSAKYKAIADIKSKKDKFSSHFKTQWDEDLDSFSRMRSLKQFSDTAFYADNLMDFIGELGRNDFFTDNFYQLNLYALSDFLVSRGVDHGFIYRYNKNDSRHVEIRFRPSKEAYEEVREKFELVARAVELKDPESVPREFGLGSMRCAFCPFKKNCWPEANTLKAWFKTQPPKDWPIDAPPQMAQSLARLGDSYSAEDEIAQLREELINELVKRDIYRIKDVDGNVYELKHLKSPRPHFEIRRSKL